MKPLRNPFFYLAFVFAIGLGFLVWGVAQAQFQEPSRSFPDGSPNPPLDTSSVTQTKTGILNVGRLGFTGSGVGLCVEDEAGGGSITCRRYGVQFGWYHNSGNIYNVNAGNVGISTSTPTYTLDVDGDIGLTGDIYQNGALFTSGGESSWILSGNSLYASSTSWNVGIGVISPTNRLSVQGNIGLLRDPGSAVTAGPGPELYFESPSSQVSNQRDEWEPCGIGSQPVCPIDNTPAADAENSYDCQIGDGGNVYTDVDDGTQKTFSTLTCVADTAVYSLRTNDGTLQFLNSNGDSGIMMTLNQSGDLTTFGLLSATGGVDVTGNITVDGNASVAGSIRTSTGGAFGNGAIYFGNHSLNSDSNWLFLYDESGDETYGATGLAVGNFSVVGNAYFGLNSSARFRGPVNVQGYIYNSTGTLSLLGDVSVSGNMDITGGLRFTDPGLANCDTIDTDTNGKLTCGTDELGTGYWLPSSGDIYYNGRVGIGMIPEAKLDVNGWIRTSGIRVDTVVVDNEIQFLDGTTQSTAAGGSPTISPPPSLLNSSILSGRAQAPGGGNSRFSRVCSSTVTADICFLSYCDIQKNDDDRGICSVNQTSAGQWNVCAAAYNDPDTFVEAGMMCANF